MTTIVHRTPGTLDTRSFTVMGMSAKPGTRSPIGQFGTGLKYSLAGLLRSGAQVSIWVGREHWQFETSTEEFRGSKFTRIHAWVRAWGGLRRRRVELPFTTQLGPHWTWWMWLRELHSNTLDEGGVTRESSETAQTAAEWWVDSDEGHGGWIVPEENQTLIVVTHPEYAAAWRDRAETFLPGAAGPADAAGRILEAIPSAPHGRVYYRGLRVLDLRLPSVTCTWNILETTPLTEDRTMPEWYARAAIARWLVAECEDEDLIAAILGADEDHWEHELEFPSHIRPTPAFERAARSVRRQSPRLGSYLGGWAPPAPPDTRPMFVRRGRRWQVAEDHVLDERGSVVALKPEAMPDEDWTLLAGTLIAAVREPASPPARPMVPMDLYAGLGRHAWDYDDDGGAVCSKCGLWVSEDDLGDVWWEECAPPAWMDFSLHP